MDSDPGFIAALEEARAGAKEGGVPIGGALVSKDGKILGRGRNMRVQNGSAILHGETAALENAGRLPASAYEGSTMYTTLSPCEMCTGACLLYGIKRVVMGENDSFKATDGGETYLREKGVEVINLNNAECKQLMKTFKEEKTDVWKAEPWAT